MREYRTDDRSAILGLAERFTEFDLPAWRDKRKIDDTNRSALAASLDPENADGTTLVAECDGSFAGFIHLQTKPDFFTKEDVGYIADLAVHPEHEGKGVAGRLLGAAEDWARGRGLKTLTLYVFDGNERALRLYEKHGFARDVAQYTKGLE